ncbi:MAG TPA: EAL domain-containing protein [Streptosporangiaceae bacterium]|nr:EAL domain-containing protein [Streptosporangiaceae bacterium]
MLILTERVGWPLQWCGGEQGRHHLRRDHGLVVPLAVNIAAQCLLAGHFAGHVAARIAEYAIEPGHLTLEITENVLIADPDRVAGVLTQLQQLGVRLSIDGYCPDWPAG